MKRKRGRGRREKRRGVTQKHPVEREIGQNRTNVIRKGNGILPGHFNGQQRPVSAENSNLELLSFRENAPCPPFTTDTIASNTIRLELLEPKLQLREQLAIPDRK